MTPTPTALLVTHLAIDALLCYSCIDIARAYKSQRDESHYIAMLCVTGLIGIVMAWTILELL